MGNMKHRTACTRGIKHPDLSKDACVTHSTRPTVYGTSAAKSPSLMGKACQLPTVALEQLHGQRATVTRPLEVTYHLCQGNTVSRICCTNQARKNGAKAHAGRSCCCHQMGGQRRNCSCAGRASCCTSLNDCSNAEPSSHRGPQQNPSLASLPQNPSQTIHHSGK